MITLSLIFVGSLLALAALAAPAVRLLPVRYTCGMGGVASLAAGMCVALLTMQAIAADQDDAPTAADRPPAPVRIADAPRANDAPPTPPAAESPEEPPAAADSAATLEPAAKSDDAASDATLPQVVKRDQEDAEENAIVEALSPAPQAEQAERDSATPPAESPVELEPGVESGEPPVLAELPPAAPPSDDTPQELSSPLMTDLQIPDNRPEWVYREPQADGDSMLVSVSSGIQDNDLDARRELDGKLVEAVSEYARKHLGRENASYFLNFSPEEIRAQFVAEELVDQPRYGETIMSEAHALLRMDGDAQQHIAARWEEAVARNRLLQVAGGAALLLLMLSMAFSYFRVDAATKGYYSGRLQMAMAVAILALLAGGVMLAGKYDLWMWLL